jgi:hypothetical protein
MGGRWKEKGWVIWRMLKENECTLFHHALKGAFVPFATDFPAAGDLSTTWLLPPLKHTKNSLC